MNLDELMTVWRSQDAAPLHGINETLLRLALRHEQANQQTQRRWERWISTGTSAFLVAALVGCLALMIHRSDGEGLTVLDFAIPIVGAAAILFWPGFLRTSHRAQARREQNFGESLRDQLNRQIAQTDYHARRIASPTHHLFTNLPAVVWTVAFFFAIVRINEKPLSDPWADVRIWLVFGGSLFACALLVAVSIAMQRRWVQRELLPRKSRLEELLKELDGQ